MQVKHSENIEAIHGSKVAILKSKWYGSYTDKLVKKCIAMLNQAGCSDIEVRELPGCLELPLAARQLIRSGEKYDAIICFGVLMKGETYHFEMILEMLSHQLSEIMLEEDFPIVVEILPVTSESQLEERCADNEFNKGLEAAKAAADIIKYRRRYTPNALV